MKFVVHFKRSVKVYDKEKTAVNAALRASKNGNRIFVEEWLNDERVKTREYQWEQFMCEF